MWACRYAGRFRWLRPKQRSNEELRENLEFAGLEVQAEEVVALALLSAILSVVLVVVIALLIAFAGLPSFVIMLTAPAPLLAYTFVGWYPSWRADRERVRALGDVPMMVSYLAMAMKITPNLERAVSFAGEQLDGRLGSSLRKMLSEAHLRLHSSADELLSKFVEHWGRWCPNLGRSIYLIRSSANDRSETNRSGTIDRAIEFSLRGVREQMQKFAAGLSLPILIIYSIGILLPLVFVVVLPVLAVINVSVGPQQIFFIYCILLPLIVYLLSDRVLARRPATFHPPQVLIKSSKVRTIMIAATIAIVPPVFSFSFNAPPDVNALAVIWSLTLGITAYLRLNYAQAFRRLEEIKRMEEEFYDALVQLGNQMSEGHPAEDAFERASETMQGNNLSTLFARVSVNVKLGGMGMRAALFDEERGVLKDVQSSTIRGTLRMLIDLVERSTRAAGNAMLKIADHLRELMHVEIEIRHSLHEVVTSMRSVALFFAPLITSVAARMQGLLVSKAPSAGFLGAGSGVSPTAFLFVLGLYILLLTVILINYSIEIELGDDRIAKRMAIAQALPIAIGVFTVGAIVGGQLLSSIIG